MRTFICLVVLILGASSNSDQQAGWYSVKFQALCEELEREVTPERAVKHGKLSAYGIQQDALANDTIRVSFDFISNCCEKFESIAAIENDTLIVSYYKINAETCRCICDYRFTYTITDTTKTWSGVKIHHLKKR